MILRLKYKNMDKICFLKFTSSELIQFSKQILQKTEMTVKSYVNRLRLQTQVKGYKLWRLNRKFNLEIKIKN